MQLACSAGSSGGRIGFGEVPLRVGNLARGGTVSASVGGVGFQPQPGEDVVLALEQSETQVGCITERQRAYDRLIKHDAKKDTFRATSGSGLCRVKSLYPKGLGSQRPPATTMEFRI